MNLKESIVEDAALECFGELGYLVGHLREAVRRLQPTMNPCQFKTH